MKSISRIIVVFAFTLSLLAFTLPASYASVTGQIGSYKVELMTEPAVIPVGRARLIIKLTDSAGNPVENAQIRSMVMMPSMPMGEKETVAIPVSGKPGSYTTDAVFTMAGSYDATLSISGSAGSSTGKVQLTTGQDTSGTAGGITLLGLLPWILGVALVAFILFRMRATGQRVNWRPMANRGAIGAILLLFIIFGSSLYAINHWRRPGAMTPIAAQAMEMNTPAPPGTAAVTLAEVTRGPVESTVHYTGQAVGFSEQDVIARVQGWLTWMPFYNGQKVKAGVLIGRLDTSQVQPQIAQQQAGVNMAQQGVLVARKEYQQTQAEVLLAHGEVGMREAAVREARANADAAREEQANAEAMLASAQSKITDMQAALQSALADQKYWSQEIAREKTLLSKGAVSTEEYQREQSQSAGADAKVRQAQAAVTMAESDVRAAQANIRKAAAMVAAADNRVQSSSAELSSHSAHVRAAEAGSDAARQKIAQMQAGVQQAQGGLASVATTRGYSEMRAQIDGVVTQRLISQGQLVNPGQAVLRIAQINPIRLQANVAETDLGNIAVGSRVVLSGQGNTNPPIVAKVTSITPSVDPVARTGIVEAVVPNGDSRFVPGQFVNMDISTGRSRDSLRIPVTAIRTRTPAGQGVIASGTTSYVWAADPVQGQTDQFTVRQVDVKTGVSDGANVEIITGLQAGQKVVVVGGDYLKSGDAVMTGLNPTESGSGGQSMPDMPGMSHGPGSGPTAPSPTATGANEATVEVSVKGFSPASVPLMAGMPAKLTFIRKDEKNCATEVTLPDYGITRSLPLNQPVVIEFTPRKGEITFTCGMKMLSGKLVAK